MGVSAAALHLRRGQEVDGHRLWKIDFQDATGRQVRHRVRLQQAGRRRGNRRDDRSFLGEFAEKINKGVGDF